MNSIRKFYPDVPIIVGDDSIKRRKKIRDCIYKPLPPNIGLSAGRNIIINDVQTEHFLLLDDDFIFTENTDIAVLIDICSDGFDIVGGRVIGSKLIRLPDVCVFGMRKGIRCKLGIHDYYNGYVSCDFIANFFAAKCDAVLGMGGWNPALKLDEHEDFL